MASEKGTSEVLPYEKPGKLETHFMKEGTASTVPRPIEQSNQQQTVAHEVDDEDKKESPQKRRERVMHWALRISSWTGIVINSLLFLAGTVALIEAIPNLSFLRLGPSLASYNIPWALFWYSLSVQMSALLGICGELHMPMPTLGIFTTNPLRFFELQWTNALWYFWNGVFVAPIAGWLGVVTALFCWLEALLLTGVFLLLRIELTSSNQMRQLLHIRQKAPKRKADEIEGEEAGKDELADMEKRPEKVRHRGVVSRWPLESSGQHRTTGPEVAPHETLFSPSTPFSVPPSSPFSSPLSSRYPSAQETLTPSERGIPIPRIPPPTPRSSLQDTTEDDDGEEDLEERPLTSQESW
jgi:hypothetical protein